MAYRDKEKQRRTKKVYWDTHVKVRIANKEAARKRYYKTRDVYKKKVFDHYGWACSCCGEDHVDFLTIDHINGGGHGQRAKVGTGRSLYRWIAKNNFPADFRTLCYNCNCGRARAGGTCPHEKEKYDRVGF